MPDVLSFGLGGGSLVRQAGGGVRIGPDSVGYELTTKGRVFGGEVLTTTDIAVAAERSNSGDRSHVADLDSGLVAAALDEIRRMVDGRVHRMRLSAAALPAIPVGRGASL